MEEEGTDDATVVGGRTEEGAEGEVAMGDKGALRRD